MWLHVIMDILLPFTTLRQRQNGCHFADDSFKCIFLCENVWISIKISLKFVPIGQINNVPALVQKMAWRRPGDKPLSEPMMASLPTHICVTRLQWVNLTWKYYTRRCFTMMLLMKFKLSETNEAVGVSTDYMGLNFTCLWFPDQWTLCQRGL